MEEDDEIPQSEVKETSDSVPSGRPKSMNDVIEEKENPLLDRKLSLGAVLEGLFEHYEANNGKLEGEFNYSELTPRSHRTSRSVIKEDGSGKVRIVSTPISPEGSLAKNAWDSQLIIQPNSR